MTDSRARAAEVADAWWQAADQVDAEAIREQLLDETAEHIARNLGQDDEPGRYDFKVVYRDDASRPPTDLEAIKDTLRSGHVWISWLDPKVADAMRAMFGPPSSGDYGS